MHYYSDTMAKVGVSRLRMSDEEDVPATSVFVYGPPPLNSGDITNKKTAQSNPATKTTTHPLQTYS
jgi:hypothetical protein